MMEPQPLLTRRPIICRRCLHGHMVEIITGREKTPVEYHCGYCGNYAIVGVNARFPFMEVVKGPKPEIKNIEISKNIKPDHDDTGSSPMQVGELLQQAVSTEDKPAQDCKPKEAPVMSEKNRIPKCKKEGCTTDGPFFGYCGKHFTETYGITYYRYSQLKVGTGEDPHEVAKRWAATQEGKPEPAPVEQKPPQDEQETPKPEQKQAKGETKAPASNEVEKQEDSPKKPTMSIVGLVGKDYITIVAKEEFINRIKEQADRDFRTPSQQVAYYLHKGMEAVKG